MLQGAKVTLSSDLDLVVEGHVLVYAVFKRYNYFTWNGSHKSVDQIFAKKSAVLNEVL